jgi:hypothetical protein
MVFGNLYMIFAAIESIRKDADRANYNAGLLAGALTKAARALAGSWYRRYST